MVDPNVSLGAIDCDMVTTIVVHFVGHWNLYRILNSMKSMYKSQLITESKNNVFTSYRLGLPESWQYVR